jgi:hypothetical protein
MDTRIAKQGRQDRWDRALGLARDGARGDSVKVVLVLAQAVIVYARHVGR